jgi:hypothetical protein
MKSIRLTINSSDRLGYALGQIRQLWEEHHYLRVTIGCGKDRTSEQNRLLHAWIRQIVETRQEFTFEQVKAQVKLHHFVPVLRAEDERFCSVYDRYIKPLPYEQKLGAIQLIDVTSICSTDQLSQGLKDMQKHYTTLETDPVYLEFPL